MALPAVKHLDPVVGVDLHSVLVTPGTPPVFLPHPHVGFMLDKREYIQAAKAVVGCIAMMIVQEKLTEYIEHHPEDVKKLEHLADEANQQVNEQLNDLMGGGKLPDFKDDPNVAEGMRLAKEANKIKNRISDDLGSNVGSGGSSGRPIFVNGMMRATAGTHAYHVPGLHFPLGESFAPPDKVEPSNDGESFMGSKTVLANNDPMSYMALEALSCWSVGMEPPPHNSAHTDRTYPSMPSSVMLPIPAGRPVLVGGPPVMNMAAAAVGLFKAFRGSEWAKNLADELHLKPGFLRCVVLDAEPVDSTTGEVIVQQHDFTVAGRLPLVWDRYYASHDTRRGAVGVGWQTPADIRLELMLYAGAVGVAAYFSDHATAFDAMPGTTGWAARVHDWQHGHALYREHDRLVLRTRAGIEHEFALPAQWRHALDVPRGDATLTLPVVRIADLNGNAWVFERGPDRSLTRLIEWKGEMSTGRMIECEAGTGSPAERHANLLTALMLVDAGGRAHPLVGYEHDDAGNLIAALDAMSQPHHFAYADDHRMVRHTSARGVSFYYSHRQHDDGVWRVDRAWGDDGLLDYRFVFDLDHRETRITDSLGHTTILQANERGMPAARIDPLGGLWSYGYDAQERASAETDPAGRTTAWEYDAYGNLLAQTLPDGSAVRAEYDADHRPICVTDAVDRHWRYAWDERGNLLARTMPTKANMRYEYDRYGQLVAHTGSGGAVTHFDYDPDGNLEAVTDALGQRTRYTHDVRANVVQIVNTLGQVSRYEYDYKGNLTRAIAPDAREVHCAYDADGNLMRYLDANGRLTRLDYSAMGQVSKRRMPDGGVIEYRYDTEAQLIGVVNERGQLYQLKRDALGRIVEEVDYWGQQRRYEYGAAGELVRSIDPLGQVIDYETDARGRIVQKCVPDPRQPEGFRIETFEYDRSGNLIVAENPDSRVELSYDAAGRVVKERQGADFVIAHVYDTVGKLIERRTRLQVGDETIAHTVRYDYDTLGAVSNIQIDDAAPITFERDALGQHCAEQLSAGLRRELSYTSDGLLTKQTLLAGTGALFVSEYGYDANGEMLEKRDSRLGVERFEYDPVGKLTVHLDPTGKLHRFLHDPAGDLLTTRIRQSNQTSIFGRSPQDDTWVREGKYGGCYCAFDRIGNLVHKRDPQQDLMLRWDGDGLLIETVTLRRMPATVGDSSGTLCLRTSYGYDVFHRRVRKNTRIEGRVGAWSAGASDRVVLFRSSGFFWNGDALVGEALQGDREVSRLLADTAPDANTMQSPSPRYAADVVDALATATATATDSYGEAREWVYYPETFRPLAGMRRAYTVDAAALQFAGRVEQGQEATRPPVTRFEPAEQYFFYVDPNGAPTRIIGPLGRVDWEGSYAAWGRVSLRGDPVELEQPLRFQGQYHDAETGLHYNRSRYYDCDTGRFISRDPIGLRAGNVEAYAPNAITWIDPLGLTKERLTTDDALIRLIAERDIRYKGTKGGTVIAGVINRETEEMEFGERGWTGVPHPLQTYRKNDKARFPNGSKVGGLNILNCGESPAFATLLATDANIVPGYEEMANLGHYTSFAWTRTGNGLWKPKTACLNCVMLYGDANLASGRD
ncbi:RHS repeat-associated core domain-containing protein [Burkholderia thailandensis]|uniref:RHS repeat-associated core domain-containing protein n=1 Tax=Burkholderia thailandensis TaxID=57975 RepID=UPI0003EC9496|nr:RHS repeat-associated core domain-containing protein [Burkholderia thailandensis]AHI66424.1 RHS repeat-associated core domain protein [Burkholderia thailandensis H0587]AVR29502.1 type IV secretion protein Rhs [Burkholderia thailandensis]TGB30571.1 type IV secretion protein Rhs [Burkholderia thailandensis]